MHRRSTSGSTWSPPRRDTLDPSLPRRSSVPPRRQPAPGPRCLWLLAMRTQEIQTLATQAAKYPFADPIGVWTLSGSWKDERVGVVSPRELSQDCSWLQAAVGDADARKPSAAHLEGDEDVQDPERRRHAGRRHQIPAGDRAVAGHARALRRPGSRFRRGRAGRARRPSSRPLRRRWASRRPSSHFGC